MTFYSLMVRCLSLLLFLCGFAQADELTLHLVPAPTRTNWSTPQKLARSALKNQIVKYNGGRRHSIGHLYVELNCHGNHFFTGSTSTGDTEERKAIFLQGYGLGVVLKNYQGKLDESQATEQDVRNMQATGRINFLRFQISENTCDRLMDYWIEYQQRGYHHVYAGLNARPLYGESSGCTAFGTSFLEIAGLLDSSFEDEWKTKLIMPRKFVGGPLTKKRVSILKILTAFRSKWDQDLSRGGFQLDFWDPEKMVSWTFDAVKALEKGESLETPWPAIRVSSDQSVGIEFDARNVPTPTGPIFKVP